MVRARERIYLGGSSVLRSNAVSETFRFNTRDDAEDVNPVIENAVASRKRLKKQACLPDRGAAKAPGQTRDPRYEMQRAMLLALVDLKTGRGERLPDRIVPELKREVRIMGGLYNWAIYQKRI